MVLVCLPHCSEHSAVPQFWWSMGGVGFMILSWCRGPCSEGVLGKSFWYPSGQDNLQEAQVTAMMSSSETLPQLYLS